jgi:hypothetical protein
LAIGVVSNTPQQDRLMQANGRLRQQVTDYALVAESLDTLGEHVQKARRKMV